MHVAPSLRPPSSRLGSLDLARGIAISLMVISHVIKGLMTFEQMPSWGIMPIHTITKFSSSTFFLVFGMTLALFFEPLVGTPRWREKRNGLLIRGIEILLWYKILTFVQLFQTYPAEQILKMLLFISFPDFVEVLGFYGFFLLWFPFVLPLWRKVYWPLKIAITAGLAFAGYYLNMNFDFWGYESLQAILVEKQGYYTFGQFQRGAMVLAGCLFGELFSSMRETSADPYGKFGLLALVLGVACLAFFVWLSDGRLHDFLMAVSRNHGKHPPNLPFTAFSVGGALIIIGLCFTFAQSLPKWLAPLTLIGRAPLFAFCFHIIMVFVFYRYLFGLLHKVSYGTAWMLTLLTLTMTAAAAWWLDRKKV